VSAAEPSTAVAKWADTSMFTAEKSHAADGPVAYLLGGPADPLGQIVACINMYKGKVVRSLADVTDAERHDALQQMAKTVLKMPLEAVSLHFMLEGVHRGITHQMVRQRTAAYAQESTRFAVKEDLADATALPPSLADTKSMAEAVAEELTRRRILGLEITDESPDEAEFELLETATGAQRARFKWDEAVKIVGETYNELVNDGMPAEDARGLMPTNITTRLNYITNLRSFLDTMAVRVSDQAQFEWRMVARAYALAMQDYGKTQTYWTTLHWDQYTSWDQKYPKTPILERIIERDPNAETGNRVKVRLSSAWQYNALVEHIRPIEFVIGRPAFDASFDRPSRIYERVAAFASRGVPSSEWVLGSEEHGIPPISPAEWLLDPNAARLAAGMEFDVFGNRVPQGTGYHWQAGHLVRTEDVGGAKVTHSKVWPHDFKEYD
jgi:flavin-dependent thymidylate synthase